MIPYHWFSFIGILVQNFIKVLMLNIMIIKHNLFNHATKSLQNSFINLLFAPEEIMFWYTCTDLNCQNLNYKRDLRSLLSPPIRPKQNYVELPSLKQFQNFFTRQGGIFCSRTFCCCIYFGTFFIFNIHSLV